MSRPTHTLYAKRKGETHAFKIGAGWANEQGWISLKLNPCVTVSDREDVYINLYPIKRENDGPTVDSGYSQDPGPPPDHDDDPGPSDNDIPF